MHENGISRAYAMTGVQSSSPLKTRVAAPKIIYYNGLYEKKGCDDADEKTLYGDIIP